MEMGTADMAVSVGTSSMGRWSADSAQTGTSSNKPMLRLANGFMVTPRVDMNVIV
jgi:hypothetical protein